MHDLPADGRLGRERALPLLAPAATIGLGGLPHRNARQAAEFGFAAYDVATAPSLPRRSPAESPIAQTLVGVPGVTLGQYGALAIDVDRLDPAAPVTTDLRGDQFGGMRAFLELAGELGHTGPIAWHFTGPISVGVALQRAGADPDLAFAVAEAAVRSHLKALTSQIAELLPESPQIVTISEPTADVVTARDCPLPPDRCVDLLSSAMAAAEARATVGLHSCKPIDLTLLVAAGPHVLSLPVSSSLAADAGHIHRFLASGGRIMWGAVATGGPIGVTANRAWHRLASLWQALVDRGCPAEVLRRQSLLSPECELGALGVSVAERVCHTLRDVSRSAQRQAGPPAF
jgi:hypothetical protein